MFSSTRLRLTTLFMSVIILTGLSLTAGGMPGKMLVGSISRPINSQGSSIYYGVNVPGWLQNLTGVSAFEHDVNKPVSIVMWYQGWGTSDGSQYFESSWMNNVRNHGSIPLVTWEPWNYTQGINQPNYSLRNIINGSFDTYITNWALASKAWGHPYFLRFAQEMNGNWYPWSENANGNQPGQYVQAWKHVHDIFTRLGATNVTWVWSPNVEYSSSTSLSELYPGTSYVDWIGMDGYNWSSIQGHHWQTFSQVFQATYNDIMHMSTGKPLMISEMASAEIGGNKASWITDALATQIPRVFPAIKAVIWFNENKETDWRVESSRTAQAAFAKAIGNQFYASSTFANLNVSPIPILKP
ncbi:MAG: glycoside hydrolase family 26 protein [Ktedonobacteraceae bacterium]